MHNNVSEKQNIISSRGETRLYSLFDNDSFTASDIQRCSGVFAVKGKIMGRTVFAVSQDYTVCGGSIDSENSEVICRYLRYAIDERVPFVFVTESVGAKLGDGVGGLDGYGKIFKLMTCASGRIPLISLVLGTCAGGSAYLSAMCDIVIMNRTSGKLFVTGAKVVKTAIGQQTTNEALGSEHIHSRNSGMIHLSGENDDECIELAKKALSYLPSDCSSLPPKHEFSFTKKCCIDTLIPQDPRRIYDVRPVLKELLDDNSFTELQPFFAENMVVGFGRLEGKSVGVLFNQPSALCGAIDIDASCKAARFVMLCDSFNIPVITFVDTPGFMPGEAQEKSGILRHGAKLLYAYSMATVPKITVLVRKAYGGAYIAMNCKGMGADYVLAFPNTALAVLGSAGANAIGASGADTPLTDAVEKGAVDEIATPALLRDKLCKLVSEYEIALQSEKKHTNIPL